MLNKMSLLNSIIFIIKIICIQLIIYCSASENPAFHMMPLGSHIKPNDVEELASNNMITPKDFVKDYMYRRKPIVFRDMASKWPAFTKWTDDYLMENYGNLEVRLTGKKGKHSKIPQGDVCLGRDSIAHFLKTYRGADVDKQVLSELPTPLYKDVNIPPPLGCGDLSKSFVEIDLWLNSGGTHTNLHKHALNSFTCAVSGTKVWQLIDSKYDDYLYQFWENNPEDEFGYGGFSTVDPETVDMKRFPYIADIREWYNVNISAGDCLFLPSQVWHVAHSKDDRNLAVTFLFSRFDHKNLTELDLDDCADKPEDLPLEQVDPDWQYSGSGRMSYGNNEISYYLDIMDGFFGKLDDQLNYELVHKVLTHLHSRLPYSEIHSTGRAKELYDKLSALCGKRLCSSKILKKITKDQLRKFINSYIHATVASNSYDHEYALFSADQVSGLFEDIAAKEGGTISQSKFINAYLDLGGHIKIAKSIWKSAAGRKESMKLKKYHKKILDAVSKFHLYELDDFNQGYEDVSGEELNGDDSFPRQKSEELVEKSGQDNSILPELATEEQSDSVIAHYEIHGTASHDEL